MLYRFDFSCEHAVVQEIVPGQEIEIWCPDSDGLSDELEALPPHLFGPDNPVFPGTHAGNPCYGPIRVQGARAGDTLAVRVLSVTPRRVGRTWTAPRHGFVSPAAMAEAQDGQEAAGSAFQWQEHMFMWDIDSDTGTCVVKNPLQPKARGAAAAHSVAMRPFPGCLATAVAPGAPQAAAMFCGAHGGNLDCADFCAGTTVYLPVAADGALLYVGDLHAAQGPSTESASLSNSSCFPALRRAQILYKKKK